MYVYIIIILLKNIYIEIGFILMVKDWVIGLLAIEISLTLLPPLACQGVFKVWNSRHQITE